MRATDASVADSAVDAAPPIACQPPSAPAGAAVVVAVDLAATGVKVGADLMGVHTAVYDGSLFTPETVALLQAAGVRSLRYPGGSYADLYHWESHTATTSAKGTAAEGVPYVAPGSDFGTFVGLLDAVGAAAVITVNYGSSPKGDGPGLPEEAAAWVAYANGDPASTVGLGTAGGIDWHTVGYWASLRAASKLAVDDGLNFLRIARAAPVGIKYWEVGNELYGNGFYYGGEGWEEDLHLLHNGTARKGNAALSPATYGKTFPAFARAMKSVDPTVKVGAVLHYPYTEYAAPGNVDWNDNVLSTDTCDTLDFGINHWYAGASLTDLLTRPRIDVKGQVAALQAKVKTRCASRPGVLPLAITEWGPNLLNFKVEAPRSTQIVGVFAADTYANAMEQGVLTLSWLELHNANYMGEGKAPVPSFGYHAQQMGHYLADVGDTMVTATVQNAPAAFTGGLLQAHAAQHLDGSVSVMVVNTSPSAVAGANITVSGGKGIGCAGKKYLYAPTGIDTDGPVIATPAFSLDNTVPVTVPAYSVAVLVFPPR